MNIEKWTMAMQEALQKAISETLSMSRQVVDIEDLLIALLEDTSGIFYRVLTKANVDIINLDHFWKRKEVKNLVLKG